MMSNHDNLRHVTKLCMKPWSCATMSSSQNSNIIWCTIYTPPSNCTKLCKILLNLKISKTHMEVSKPFHSDVVLGVVFIGFRILTHFLIMQAESFCSARWIGLSAVLMLNWQFCSEYMLAAEGLCKGSLSQ